MKFEALLSQLTFGKESRCQFKADVKNAESLALEMAAFVYARGVPCATLKLPKLISCELRIQDAEEFLKRANS